MKENTKIAAKLFLKTVIVNLLCFIIVISVSVLTSAVFSNKIGYVAYGIKDGNTDYEKLYEYYYEDGEDTKREAFIKQGYTILEDDIQSDISKSGDLIFLLLSQIFCLMLLFAIVYPTFWQLGAKDKNLVKFEHIKEEKFRGFKVAFVSVIPYIILLAFFLITKNTISSNFSLNLFRIINSSYFGLITLLRGNALFFGDLEIARGLLLFLIYLFVPAISQIGYSLGFRNISISELLTFKKKDN